MSTDPEKALTCSSYSQGSKSHIHRTSLTNSSQISPQNDEVAYSPLSVKHQLYYQAHAINFKNNYDQANTQRQQKQRQQHQHQKQLIESVKKQEAQLMRQMQPYDDQLASISGLSSSEISFQQQPMKTEETYKETLDQSIQEGKTIRQFQEDKHNKDFTNEYQINCQQMQDEIESSHHEIRQLMQYQKALMYLSFQLITVRGKIEETTFSFKHLMKQNGELQDHIVYLEGLLENERHQYRLSNQQLCELQQKTEELMQVNTQLASNLKTADLSNRLKCNQIVQLQAILGSENEPSKQIQQEHKFTSCILEMISMCHPPQEEKISLKKAWKWLKQLLDEYMQLKKIKLEQPKQRMTSREPVQQTQTNSMSNSTYRPLSELRYSSSQLHNLKQIDVLQSRESFSKNNHNHQQSETNIHVGSLIRNKNLKQSDGQFISNPIKWSTTQKENIEKTNRNDTHNKK